MTTPVAYSKNAFNCNKCPGKGGAGGCPAWWETTWEKPDGEVKLVKGCGWEQLPLYLIEVIKASNRPAAAIESTRNEVALLASSIQVLPQVMQRFPQLATDTGNNKKYLERK